MFEVKIIGLNMATSIRCERSKIRSCGRSNVAEPAGVKHFVISDEPTGFVKR
jgi:hypothetical protein